MRIMIAGGGTGGHLFPGIALAEEFHARNPAYTILFVGTTRGLEQRVVPALGYSLRTLTSAGIVGSGIRGKLIGLLSFIVGFFQALHLIVQFRPDLVIGTGGYVSAPVIISAWILRKRTAICEQNSIPGLTNRMLGKIAGTVFIAFGESKRFFPHDRTIDTGNPIRRAFLQTITVGPEKSDRFCILILGGSQGARSLNQAVVATLDRLQPLRNEVEFIHQTGYQDQAWVESAYHEKGLTALVTPFIDDMARWYRRADLVISRAGAITLTELLISGKASILVPYPYAAYNHQEMNAQSVVDKGAAAMILDQGLKDGSLGDVLLDLYHHRSKLEEMGSNARSLARPEAARAIVDHVAGSRNRR